MSVVRRIKNLPRGLVVCTIFACAAMGIKSVTEFFEHKEWEDGRDRILAREQEDDLLSGKSQLYCMHRDGRILRIEFDAATREALLRRLRGEVKDKDCGEYRLGQRIGQAGGDFSPLVSYHRHKIDGTMQLGPK